MEHVLFSDPLLEIIHYLSPKDVLSLVNSSVKCKKIIKYVHFRQVIIIEINRRLRNIFGDFYEEFKYELENNQAIISGSFILQCILGEEWQGSDIDIYLPTKGIYMDQYGFTNLENFFYHHLALIEFWGKNYENNIIDGTRKYAFYKEKHLHEVNAGLNPNEIYQIYREKSIEYIEPNVSPIQIIKLEADFEEAMNFIRNDFDFDIIKNNYYIKDGVEYLEIKNLKDILSRKTIFRLSQTFRHEWNRKKKYEDRGFEFFYDQNPREYIKSFENPIRGIIKIGQKIIFEVERLSENRFRILSSNFKPTNKNCVNSISSCIEYEISKGYNVSYKAEILGDIAFLSGYEKCKGNCPVDCFWPEKEHFHIPSLVDHIFIVK